MNKNFEEYYTENVADDLVSLFGIVNTEYGPIMLNDDNKKWDFDVSRLDHLIISYIGVTHSRHVEAVRSAIFERCPEMISNKGVATMMAALNQRKPYLEEYTTWDNIAPIGIEWKCECCTFGPEFIRNESPK